MCHETFGCIEKLAFADEKVRMKMVVDQVCVFIVLFVLADKQKKK